MFGKGPQTRDLAGHLPYYVLRQASRRSWRIGQQQPVEVTFLAYEGTLQADALGLVAAKTRASLMIEGELPAEGLAALDGDGGDVFLALARRLAEPASCGEGQPQSLEALFAEARRSEDEREDVLVARGWDDEPEMVPEPLQYAECPASASPGTVDELPLFIPTPLPTPPQASAPASRVVTLEQLARLLVRPKPKPKPAPEGQLALFGGWPKA